MIAKEFTCRVVEAVWATPTVLRLRFESLKKFHFEPGQFLSIIVPPKTSKDETAKRCYSFASTPEEAKTDGVYELCVKYVPNGRGSSYLASLTVGDTFRVFAAYGSLQYKAPGAGRSVCFISTGTGIAPFRSMILSKRFSDHPPERALLIHGVRTEDEILYQGEMEKAGAKVIYTVSQAPENYTGHKGRVTDFLRTLPSTWRWHTTDFYICGNGDMIREVTNLLHGGFGVKKNNIHAEAFSTTPKTQVVAEEPKVAKAGPFALLKKIA